jgi:hypothetical protein
VSSFKRRLRWDALQLTLRSVERSAKLRAA